MQPDSKGWMVAGIAWDACSQGKAFTQIFTDYFLCPSVSPLSPLGKARLFCSQKVALGLRAQKAPRHPPAELSTTAPAPPTDPTEGEAQSWQGAGPSPLLAT